ncbi:MAG: oligosaccharide flippase family protein [Gammaproteobacteria bacterium]|nr:oligosaccharide flippase family protein [Gammaproteobacteria bacterium]
MSLKRNVLANYFGQAYAAVMALAFVPLYIKYLGIEAYGLIGIFVVLQAWLALLDMGMKPALAREMARFTGGGIDAQSVWDLLRSVEVIALGIAALTSVGMYFAAGWLATSWVRPEQLSEEAVVQAFALMGLVIAARFVENIYTNSIAGLQRQVLQNAITIVMATLRGLGSVAVLIWVSPTIEAFFIWQGMVSVATAVIFMGVVYKILPNPPRAARFSSAEIRNIWKFAAGMMGITFLALLLTQIDKILLSRLLTLEAFGYYSLAAVVAGGLHIMTAPVGTAFYPRFTELITRRNELILREAYHLAAQLVTVLMGSAAVILIVFCERILLLWTADPELTARVAPIAGVLALGTGLNCLLWIPYQMQLAHGWTSLTIRINTVAVILLVPTILWVVPAYGVIGAAWVWVILNSSFLVFSIYFMHRRLLPAEKWLWYRQDVVIPLVVSIAAALSLRWLLPDELNRISELGALLVSSGCVLVAASVAAPLVRKQLFQHVDDYFARTK